MGCGVLSRPDAALLPGRPGSTPPVSLSSSHIDVQSTVTATVVKTLDATQSNAALVDNNGVILHITGQLSSLANSNLIGQSLHLLLPEVCTVNYVDHPTNSQKFDHVVLRGPLQGCVCSAVTVTKVEASPAAPIFIIAFDVVTESDTRYALAVRDAQAGMMMINSRGEIVIVNRKMLQLFHYDNAQELLGQKMEMLLHPKLRARHPMLRDRFFKNPNPNPRLIVQAPTMMGYTKDGIEIPLEIALTPIQTKDGLLALAGFQDYSEQHRLEQRFATAVEAAPSGLCIFAADGTVEVINAQLENMLQISRRDAVTMNVNNVMPLKIIKGNDISPIDLTAIKEENWGSVIHDVWCEPHSGPHFPLEVRLSKLEDGRILASVTDITYRKVQEEKQRAADAAELIAKNSAALLATMSHEIRTPLTGLLGCLQLLQGSSLPRGVPSAGSFSDADSRPATPRAITVDVETSPAELIAVAQRCGKVLMETINDILAYSRLEAGREEAHVDECHVEELLSSIHDVLRPALESKGLTWQQEVHSSVPSMLYVDVARVRRVLLNLTNNAVKFSHAGCITVRVRCSSSTEDVGPAGTPRLYFDVADDGEGIAADKLPSIFQPFVRGTRDTTRKADGTGLGLAICRGLVQVLGGEISVQSKLNVGSTFSFWVPVELPGSASSISGSNSVIKRSASSSSVSNSNVDVLPSMHILLVDDDKVGASIIGNLLKRMGCGKVSLAANGSEAVELATKHADIDLIFMDCEMPVMDGFTATQKLREMCIKAPIIAMTANAMIGDRERCLRAGMDDYLSKPVTKAELRKMISRVEPSTSPSA